MTNGTDARNSCYRVTHAYNFQAGDIETNNYSIRISFLITEGHRVERFRKSTTRSRVSLIRNRYRSAASSVEVISAPFAGDGNRSRTISNGRLQPRRSFAIEVGKQMPEQTRRSNYTALTDPRIELASRYTRVVSLFPPLFLSFSLLSSL